MLLVSYPNVRISSTFNVSFKVKDPCDIQLTLVGVYDEYPEKCYKLTNDSEDADGADGQGDGVIVDIGVAELVRPLVRPPWLVNVGNEVMEYG